MIHETRVGILTARGSTNMNLFSLLFFMFTQIIHAWIDGLYISYFSEFSFTKLDI